jgi:hypothetical protein
MIEHRVHVSIDIIFQAGTVAGIALPLSLNKAGKQYGNEYNCQSSSSHRYFSFFVATGLNWFDMGIL